MKKPDEYISTLALYRMIKRETVIKAIETAQREAYKAGWNEALITRNNHQNMSELYFCQVCNTQLVDNICGTCYPEKYKTT